LFDLDGTLVDSEGFHAEAIARALHDAGLELDDRERAFVIGHAWTEIHRFCRVQERIGMDLPTLQRAALRAKESMDAREGLRMIEGARALVDLGKRLELPMAIVTGSSRPELEEALEVLAIRELLAFSLSFEDYPRGKPAPDGYLMAASRLGLAPAGCVVFEDSHAGIASARAAGMKVVAIAAANPPPGTPGHQDQSSADHHVAHPGLVDEALLRALFDSTRV
jgi:beta-phosphoglucomutase-like phosphatase (HAD superfamily)